MSDNYVLQSSLQDTSIDASVFQERYTLRIPDSNNKNYGSSKVDFSSLAQLSTLDALFSAKESHIEIPYTSTIATSVAMTAGAQQVYAMGLKGFLNIVDGLSCQIDGQNMLDAQPLSQIPANFKILSAWSQDNLHNYASTINMAIDTNGFDYTDVVGEHNNLILPNAFATATEDNALEGTSRNLGHLQRMSQTNYNPDKAIPKKFSTIALAVEQKKSHYAGFGTGTTDAPTSITVHYLAIIPLKYLSSLFENMPLVRGIYMKMILNINSSKTTFTSTAGAQTAVVATSVFNHCPVMISKMTNGNNTGLKSSDGLATDVTLTCGIAKSGGVENTIETSCYLNAVMYKLNPKIEESYFSSNTVRTIKYSQYQYNVSNNIASNQSANFLIAPSLSKIRSILICPVISGSVNGSGANPNAKGAGSAFSTLISPFTSSGNTCVPYGCGALSQLQIKIGGKPHFQTPKDYCHDMFLNEILSANSLNGGIENGLSSGLISQQMFSTTHGFIFINLSRKVSDADDVIPKPLELIGKNNSLCMVDYHCFVELEYERKIDITSGKIVV